MITVVNAPPPARLQQPSKHQPLPAIILRALAWVISRTISPSDAIHPQMASLPWHARSSVQVRIGLKQVVPGFCLWLVLAWPGLLWAHGPWRAQAGNTPGWSLMTPAERIAHQARVRQFDDHAACLAYQQELRQRLQTRARAQGLPLPGARRDFCAHLLRPGSDSPAHPSSRTADHDPVTRTPAP